MSRVHYLAREMESKGPHLRGLGQLDVGSLLYETFRQSSAWRLSNWCRRVRLPRPRHYSRIHYQNDINQENTSFLEWDVTGAYRLLKWQTTGSPRCFCSAPQTGSRALGTARYEPGPPAAYSTSVTCSERLHGDTTASQKLGYNRRVCVPMFSNEAEDKL